MKPWERFESPADLGVFSIDCIWYGIFTLFDICCIICCIHASFRKQEMPLLALIRQGFKTSLRVIYQRNIIMMLYLLIIIPMTHALVISGYITKFTVPQFIVDYIMSHTWLAILYVGFWVLSDCGLSIDLQSALFLPGKLQFQAGA